MCGLGTQLGLLLTQASSTGSGEIIPVYYIHETIVRLLFVQAMGLKRPIGSCFCLQLLLPFNAVFRCGGLDLGLTMMPVESIARTERLAGSHLELFLPTKCDINNDPPLKGKLCSTIAIPVLHRGLGLPRIFMLISLWIHQDTG